MTRFGPGFIGGGLDQYTKALLHFDGSNGSTTFTDVAKPSRVWTARGSAQISTGASKFGGSSLFVASGGGTGCIDAPDDADFALGSGDFTIDCWFNSTGASTTASRMLFGQNDASNTSSSWSVRGALSAPAAGNLIQFTGVVGSTFYTAQAGAYAAPTGWRHFAGVRSGSSLLAFVDGTLINSVAISGSINNSANRFAIGRPGELTSTNLDWEGYLDEFRLSVGIARWTSNFTPPTSPYS